MVTSYYATCFVENTFILPVSVIMHANTQHDMHETSCIVASGPECSKTVSDGNFLILSPEIVFLFTTLELSLPQRQLTSHQKGLIIMVTLSVKSTLYNDFKEY